MEFNKETVVSMLQALGCVVTEEDDWLIDFTMNNVTNTIKNQCNVTEVPEGLNTIAVDMACGEFLHVKRCNGQLQIDGLDLSGTIKSISEGDVSISFDANTNDETKLTLLIDYLIGRKGELLRYRKLCW